MEKNFPPKRLSDLKKNTNLLISFWVSNILKKCLELIKYEWQLEL